MTNAFMTSGIFGGLFSDPAVEAEFSASVFTQRMLAFEAAWTEALVASGVVEAEAAEPALAAIQGFDASDLGEGSTKDGLPVPTLVAALKSGLSEQSARAVHWGATSQDVIDTAMMLTCISVTEMFKTRISNVLALIDTLLARSADKPLMARTRMQAALPATVGLRLEAWRRPLAAHIKRADAILAELSEVQIGGPIGSRDLPQAHVKACAQTVADRLGLSLGDVWHTDRSRVVAFGNWMTLVAGTLGKIGQDVALMAQQGVDEIALSGSGGSSAMPHKQNPVAAETMVTLARYVAGQQGILGQAMIHEQERSGAAWALEWLTLPAMAEATGAALLHAERLIPSIERIGTPDAPRSDG
ncbi:3-carboxy-cis,cis-muconate cycloisomerase [Lentibacter algarum]|uniref:3-carboxy-cis,cis-muconate cycloisomerase n=1 Tax=Lentibacter algarum TaxID=576131 RepID=UPI001C07EBF2|nr:3-carboxy-cis,cis-muconate cycloisomerase [Lentibacter algarum]MBU2980239.1 3-carboxy-cis,cis-muconate cycloisomerase [Lentibacter algarum]